MSARRLVTVTIYDHVVGAVKATGEPITIAGVLPAIVAREPYSDRGGWACMCMRSGMTLLGPWPYQTSRASAIRIAEKLVSARTPERIAELIETAVASSVPVGAEA